MLSASFCLRKKYWYLFRVEGILGTFTGTNFLCPWTTLLALQLICSKLAFSTPQKVLSHWKMVDYEMVGFSDCTRYGISILSSAAVWLLRGEKNPRETQQITFFCISYTFIFFSPLTSKNNEVQIRLQLLSFSSKAGTNWPMPKKKIFVRSLGK